MKINPQVIEGVLLSVLQIAEAAAFGVPDALGIARIWAAIVPNGPVDMSAVKDADLDFRHVEPVRRRGLGRASLGLATNLPSAGKPAPTSPRPRARAHEPAPTSPRPRAGSILGM